MAQHPESKFGNALVASMRQYDYNVLMDIRVPMGAVPPESLVRCRHATWAPREPCT